jgi:hypothetical protein
MLEKDLLVYHYGQIEGIQRVKAFAPRTIKDANLPLVVLFADELATVSRSAGRTTKTRDIRAVLFVESVNMGTEDSSYERTDPFFDRVEAYFEARTTLALADGTTFLIHEYMNDEGETLTPYPTGAGGQPGQFWTITFNHRFSIVKEVIYQSGN